MLERFLALAAEDPRAAALLDGERIITRVELLARARALAEELPLDAGSLLGIQLPNSAQLIATFLAALMRKLVVVPVDRDSTPAEVETIAEHFAIQAIVQRTGIVVRDESRRAAIPADARLIKLTSGSTGKPKGIVATEANLIADCENICSTMDITPSDLNLGTIPFSHSYGFSNLVTPLLWQGTPVVVTNDYLPQSLIELANRHRCTVAPLIPMVFEHLATAAHGAFESIRTFISAGAPLPPSTSRRFRERFGIDIHSFYGCSECGGITYDRAGAAVERGTVGAAMNGVELTIDNTRLTVRSGSVAAGTLLDANTFVPFESNAFMTDDLVALRDGELVLTGRASDLINTAGKKVNPREVELLILQLDGVREAKVYGEPAGARGEVVAVAVVASPDVTREQIREHCRAHLSPHKVPRIVKLIDELPVDERGKIKRAALATL